MSPPRSQPNPHRCPGPRPGRSHCATQPTTSAELAEIVGLHENTLRGHLDALRKAGHVSRFRETGESGGRAWGEQLRALFDEDGQTPHERLMRALEHVGFGPETSADETSVRLTRCPFIDAARAHPEAVCSVHLGLIEGALGESLDPAALQPFVEPGACLVTLPVPATQE